MRILSIIFFLVALSVLPLKAASATLEPPVPSPQCEPFFWSTWRYINIIKRYRVIWDLSAAAIFCKTWRERNNRLLMTKPICYSLMSYWFNLLSGRARERVMRVLTYEERYGSYDHKGYVRKKKRKKDDFLSIFRLSYYFKVIFLLLFTNDLLYYGYRNKMALYCFYLLLFVILAAKG